MPNPEAIADESQVAELFNSLVVRSAIHGMEGGSSATWIRHDVEVPDAILLRSGVRPDQATGYDFMAFAPKLVENEANSELFSSQTAGQGSAIVNFLQSKAVKLHSPKPHIQHRLTRAEQTGHTIINKYYPGESVDFSPLDEADDTQKCEAQIIELETLFPQQELSRKDMLEALGHIGMMHLRGLDANFGVRRESEDLQRSLGLSTVYADEVEGLLNLIDLLANTG